MYKAFGFVLVCSILVFFSSFSSASSDDDDQSDVLTLTDFTIDDAIARHSPLLLEFYAPWCGHCKNLAPQWELAATALKGLVTVAKIDAQENQESAAQYQIQGFPTIKWFQDGQAFEYQGPRDADGIVQWAKKRLNPIIFVSDLAALEEVRAQNDITVAANMNKESAGWAIYSRFALSAQDTAFVALSGAAAEGVAPDTFLVSSRWKPVTPFTGEIESLPAFVQKNMYPRVMKAEDGNSPVFSRLFSSGLPFALVFLNNDENLQSNLALLDGVAERRSECLFAWLDVAQWEGVLPRLGASGNFVPTAIAWEPSDPENPKRPLVFDEDSQFSFDALEAWMQQVADGTATTWRNSEPIPTSHEGAVRTVVWKTFEEEVLSSDKVVFVEFYAPWCGHCKSLAPVWEQVAQHFQGNNGVVIAKYDATANFVPEEYGVQGFPTLKLFVPGADPIDYNEARDASSLIAFVEKHL